MANNDQILLDQIVEEQRLARVPAASKSEFFETYVSEQVLKDYDLSDDEIEYGLVGSGLDGGIDSIYTFANGELVQEDFEFQALKKSVLIEVVIIQSKTSNGFDEDALHKLMAVTDNLFQLANPVDKFKGTYNDGVLSAVQNFRRLYTGIAARFPDLRFRYIYATRGDSTGVHPNVKKKVEALAAVLKKLFANAEFQFEFIGATDLLELARRRPANRYEVEFTEGLSAKDGYIALLTTV